MFFNNLSALLLMRYFTHRFNYSVLIFFALSCAFVVAKAQSEVKGKFNDAKTTVYAEANSQTEIKGKVTDAKTAEPLIGATVHIESATTSLNTIVRLDGSYLFKNLNAGTYKLQVKYVGYKTTKEYTVELGLQSTAILNIAMVDNDVALNEVNIVEHASKESDKTARLIEKNSDNTMNLVSAMSIAISPDVIISNVLGRVPGISLDRGKTGDGQYVIIRGMDKKYNTTLINGVKIPSPDNKNRFVPLDVFPADLVGRVEVSKTLTPDMEADASGGVVNMIMKTAPDRLRVEGNFGTGYSQLFFDRHFASFDPSAQNANAPGEYIPTLAFASPNSFPYQNLITNNGTPPPNTTASLTIGNRFFNKKLGVIFSGSFQNIYAGNNSFYAPPAKVVGPAEDINSEMSASAFESSNIRQYSSKIDRTGLNTAFDYKLNDNNTISLLGTYIQLDEHRVRETTKYTYGGYSYMGYHWTNAIDQLTETRSDLQNIYSAILRGEHKISSAFKVDWSATTSEATDQLPDVAEFDITQKTTPVGTGGSYQPTPGNPTMLTYLAPATITDTARTASEARQWRRNTDRDISGYLNLHYDTKVFGRKALFSAGAMFRHKTRSAFNDTYSLYPVSDANSPQQIFVSIPASKFVFLPQYNAQGTSYYDAGVYTFFENVQGAYGEMKYYPTDKLDVIFGMRSESTLQHYEDSGNPALGGQSATITYNDYLPSINLKYALTGIQALRASYYQSIYRPTAYDLIPAKDGLPDGSQYQGNPNLQHTTINNFDLRYEAFPGLMDEFMLGAFYKELINSIEKQYTEQDNTITPVNLNDAHNYGFEAVAKKFFGNIGFSANYTYTDSRITSTKKIMTQTSSTTQNVTFYVPQVRPLQGQSQNVANFSLLYKSAKNGIDAQLALSYTGERINAVSQWKDLDIWEKASTNLDFSAQKEFKKKYVFFVKINNILNTPYELFIKQDNSANYNNFMKYYYQESPNYTTVEYDKYYARYSIGFRFKIN